MNKEMKTSNRRRAYRVNPLYGLPQTVRAANEKHAIMVCLGLARLGEPVKVEKVTVPVSLADTYIYGKQFIGLSGYKSNGQYCIASALVWLIR